MVAFTLMGILLLFGFRFLAFLQGRVADWQRTQQLQQGAYQIAASIRRDCQECGVVFTSDSLTIRIPMQSNASIPR